MPISPGRNPARGSTLRILNVIRFPIGGIRSYLRYTYSRFDPRHYAATVVTVDRPEAQLIPAGMAPVQVTLKTVPERSAFIGLVMITARLLRQGEFDLVHSQGTTAALVTDLSAAGHSIPHVVTLHETFRADQFSGVFGAIKKYFVQRALRRADAVIAVSHDARKNLLEHFRLRPEQVHVVRNGIAADLLRQEIDTTKLDVRARESIPESEALLGYVGRFMPEKGFDVLLDSVAELKRRQNIPPFKVVAVNDGAFLREYREQIAQMGLDAVFVFAGFQASAAGVLTEFDAVVMPSRREACPMVAMEALSLGCPLIASDCLGLRELTKGTPALSTTAGDARSLADAIEKFLANPAHFAALARDYAATASAEFDSSRTAATLAGIFERARAGTALVPARPGV